MEDNDFTNELFEKALKEAEEYRENMSKWDKFCEWFTEWVIFYIWLKPIDVIDTAYNNVKHGICNLFHFFKVVWNYRNWDVSYSIELFQEGLRQLRDGMVNEKNTPRNKRRKAINEFIKLLSDITDDEYGDNSDWKEYKQGIITIEEWKNNKNKRRDKVYERINHLMKGQDYSKFKPKSRKTREEDYNRWFDGSGIEGWWD